MRQRQAVLKVTDNLSESTFCYWQFLSYNIEVFLHLLSYRKTKKLEFIYRLKLLVSASSLCLRITKAFVLD